MPRFLEDKLRAEYGNNPHAIYGTLNAIGAMHGNKETPKGRAMDAKHAKDMLHPKMRAHGQMVKEAHAHLKAAVPEYQQATGRQKMMMAQEHVRARKGR